LLFFAGSEETRIQKRALEKVKTTVMSVEALSAKTAGLVRHVRYDLRGDKIGLYGTPFSFSMFLLAAVLHFINAPYTFMTQWVSNMGAKGTIARPVFNRGLQIMAVLLALFLIEMGIRFWSDSKKANVALGIAMVSGLVAAVGIFILTIWDMFSDPDAHYIGAYMFFISTPIFMIFSLIAINTLNMGSKQQKIVVGLIVGLYFAFFPVMLYSVSQLLYPSVPLVEITTDQWIGLTSNMSPALGYVRFLEWFLVIGLFVWLMQTSFHLKKK
jgi:hypothetical protein